jgi:hypothetical protein
VERSYDRTREAGRLGVNSVWCEMKLIVGQEEEQEGRLNAV